MNTNIDIAVYESLTDDRILEGIKKKENSGEYGNKGDHAEELR